MGTVSIITLGVIIGVAIVFIVIYKKSKNTNLSIETVDSEVSFDDIVSYFKSLELKKEDGTCFIITEKKKEFHKLIYKNGYSSLGLFVININGKIVNGKILHAKSFDKKTIDTIGNVDVLKLG